MKVFLIITAIILFSPHPVMAEDNQRLPYISEDLLDTCKIETLGLAYPHSLKTITIFSPKDNDWHYANGVVMTAFKDTLYCMWQSSRTDEDSPETRVVYSSSRDEGQTWSMPRVLIEATDSCYYTSGGWIASADTLVAFVNRWPKDIQPIGGFTEYMYTADGNTWSRPQPVRMADGKPMNGIIEQDPYRLADGRIIAAVHFQPGLHVSPVYTDSAIGYKGWKKAIFEGHDRGKQSRELEPSIYQQKDGTLVMVFRDQSSSYCKMASMSHDRGQTWTEPVLTNIPDARVKQSAGNLPDGTAYLVGCPTQAKRRWPLTVLLSNDGICFDKGFLLRAGGDDLQSQRFPGKAKALGYNYPKSLVYKGKLYVAYATNKEDVEISILTY